METPGLDSWPLLRVWVDYLMTTFNIPYAFNP